MRHYAFAVARPRKHRADCVAALPCYECDTCYERETRGASLEAGFGGKTCPKLTIVGGSSLADHRSRIIVGGIVGGHVFQTHPLLDGPFDGPSSP
jgi:hypothetical protein